MELIPLSDYYRKASLGYEYPELTIEYNNWSHDLHLKGNYIDNEKLKTMSIYGLIRWYFKKLSFFTIDYNYKQIERFINNPENIQYYDIKCINKIAKFFEISNDFVSNLNLEIYDYKYKFLFAKYKFCHTNKNEYNKNIVNKYSNVYGTRFVTYMNVFKRSRI